MIILAPPSLFFLRILRGLFYPLQYYYLPVITHTMTDFLIINVLQQCNKGLVVLVHGRTCCYSVVIMFVIWHKTQVRLQIHTECDTCILLTWKIIDPWAPTSKSPPPFLHKSKTKMLKETLLSFSTFVSY